LFLFRMWLVLRRFQMSILVEQQDETINVIETQAAAVEKDMEVGYVEVSVVVLC